MLKYEISSRFLESPAARVLRIPFGEAELHVKLFRPWFSELRDSDADLHLLLSRNVSKCDIALALRRFTGTWQGDQG